MTIESLELLQHRCQLPPLLALLSALGLHPTQPASRIFHKRKCRNTGSVPSFQTVLLRTHLKLRCSISSPPIQQRSSTGSIASYADSPGALRLSQTMMRRKTSLKRGTQLRLLLAVNIGLQNKEWIEGFQSGVLFERDQLWHHEDYRTL